MTSGNLIWTKRGKNQGNKIQQEKKWHTCTDVIIVLKNVCCSWIMFGTKALVKIQGTSIFNKMFELYSFYSWVVNVQVQYYMYMYFILDDSLTASVYCNYGIENSVNMFGTPVDTTGKSTLHPYFTCICCCDVNPSFCSIHPKHSNCFTDTNREKKGVSTYVTL